MIPFYCSPIYTKVAGIWKPCVAFQRIAGVWTAVHPYIRIGGNWKG